MHDQSAPQSGLATPFASDPPPIVLVGTHHKVGTVWMRKLFERAAKACGRPFLNISRRLMDADTAEATLRDNIASDVAAVVFSAHSEFPRTLPMDRCRGFHLVRDPREMLVSATDYHEKATERWLHFLRPEFDGLTYQQKQRACGSLEARQRFELHHAGGRAIRRMLDFEEPQGFKTWRYEDLIADEEMAVWVQVASHLGFVDKAREQFLAAVWKESLFGDLVPKGQQRLHIQSGGTTPRWPRRLAPSVRAELEARYGGAMRRMGYC